jgi:hypothetical protein
VSGDSLRFLVGEAVESPRQRPREGEGPRDTAARRLEEEFLRRVQDLRALYGRWGPAAAALERLREGGLEARLDAGAALASVQVRNSRWSAVSASEMLALVVPAFGLGQRDISNLVYQRGIDTLSFSAVARAHGRGGAAIGRTGPEGPAGAVASGPAAPETAASELPINFTLMGPGSVVGHWPPS